MNSGSVRKSLLKTAAMTSRRRDRVGAGQTNFVKPTRAHAITPLLSRRRSQANPSGARAQTASLPQSNRPQGARGSRRASTASARGDSSRTGGGQQQQNIVFCTHVTLRTNSYRHIRRMYTVIIGVSFLGVDRKHFPEATSPGGITIPSGAAFVFKRFHIGQGGKFYPRR